MFKGKKIFNFNQGEHNRKILKSRYSNRNFDPTVIKEGACLAYTYLVCKYLHANPKFPVNLIDFKDDFSSKRLLNDMAFLYSWMTLQDLFYGDGIQHKINNLEEIRSKKLENIINKIVSQEERAQMIFAVTNEINHRIEELNDFQNHFSQQRFENLILNHRAPGLNNLATSSDLIYANLLKNSAISTSIDKFFMVRTDHWIYYGTIISLSKYEYINYMYHGGEKYLRGIGETIEYFYKKIQKREEIDRCYSFLISIKGRRNGHSICVVLKNDSSYQKSYLYLFDSNIGLYEFTNKSYSYFTTSINEIIKYIFNYYGNIMELLDYSILNIFYFDDTILQRARSNSSNITHPRAKRR